MVYRLYTKIQFDSRIMKAGKDVRFFVVDSVRSLDLNLFLDSVERAVTLVAWTPINTPIWNFVYGTYMERK